MRADASTEQEIRAAVQRLTDAYAGRDMAGLLACFAPDEDTVMYGTGADERRVGPAGVRTQAQRDWDQTDEVAMDFDRQTISMAGDVAWAALDGTFRLSAGGESMALPARATLVFERRDGRWLVVHGHFSLPAEGQEEGESF